MQFGLLLLPQGVPGRNMQLATGVQAPQNVSVVGVQGPWICLPTTHDAEHTVHAEEPVLVL